MTMGLFKNGFTYKRKQKAAENVTVGDSIRRQRKKT